MNTEHQPPRKDTRRVAIGKGVGTLTTLLTRGLSKERAVPHLDLSKTLNALVFAQELPGPDFVIPNGRFYTQRGDAKQPGSGFAVVDDDRAPMWTIFQQNGGVDVWGYPISGLFTDEVGRVCQVFQRGRFQVRSDARGTRIQSVEWNNSTDILRDKGVNLDNPVDLIPPPVNGIVVPILWGHDRNGGLPGTVETTWITAVFGKIPQYPQLREKYFANPQWFEQYGLPIGVKDYGPLVVVLTQRSFLQLWKGPTPWTNNQPMQTIVGLGGELEIKYGLVPKEAMRAVEPPAIGGGSERGNGDPLTREPWIKYGAPTLEQRPLVPRKIAVFSADGSFSHWIVDERFLPENRIDRSELRGGIVGSEKFIHRVEELFVEKRRIDPTGYAELIREVDHVYESPTMNPSLASISWQNRTIIAGSRIFFRIETFPGEANEYAQMKIEHEKTHIIDRNRNPNIPRRETEINAYRSEVLLGERVGYTSYLARSAKLNLEQILADPNYNFGTGLVDF
ncbi:MAG: hypothetical protein Q8R11_02220 [bacterium]|nr:hypothetical protein [bacterium]